MFTIESVAHNLVIICFPIPKWPVRLLARLVGCMYTYLVFGPFVQLISREISQATSSLTFSTRNLILDPWGSTIEARGTVNLLLSGTVSLLVECCIALHAIVNKFTYTCPVVVVDHIPLFYQKVNFGCKTFAFFFREVKMWKDYGMRYEVIALLLNLYSMQNISV